MSKLKSKMKLNKSKVKKSSKKRVKFSLKDNKTKEMENLNEESEDLIEDNEDIDSTDEELDSFVDHKKSLESLKEKDPEFYKFLQQNDKQLLDYEISDEELDVEEDNDSQDLDEIKISNKISVKQIDEWSDQLKEKVDIQKIKAIVKWFRKAVNQTNGETDGHIITTDAFNAIINICLIDLLPAIHKFLKLPQIGSKEWSNEVRAIDPTKSRNWKKVISIMKCYLTDVIKMVSIVSDDSLKSSILRHILHLIPFVITFPHLIKRVLKQMINLWSESDTKNGILSFICILRLMRTQEQHMISFILKKLYISYVKNCKFTTQSNRVIINFMKHSLVELYSLDQTIAYQHSFVFIRQLAINLRTAMTLKKKESYKSVYNWQYLHSIQLWTHLLCSQNTVEELKPLICPLVNVIIGTIRLIPSPNFFPMRFHLINALIRLSESTNTFIPVLPLITEVFEHLDKTKKNESNHKKELNFDLLIKVSKLNSSGIEFKSSTINKVYDLILHYLSTQSHRISFPELVFISVNKMRKFVKLSHNIECNQLLKQLIDKIEENSKFINEKRKNVEFSITDNHSINSWENHIKSEGTPLNTFFNQRKRLKAEKESEDIIPESLDNQEIDLNSEQTSDKMSEENVSKNRKSKKRINIDNNRDNSTKPKKSKKRVSNEKTINSDSFDLNQCLNISSDESD